MAEVVIRWDQRAHGREIGETEQVERTDFVDAIIAQGRVTVLEEIAPVIEEDGPVTEPVEEKPKPKARKAVESKDEDGVEPVQG